MKIKASSEVEVIDPNSMITSYCNDHLKLLNPDYIKKKRMGKWLGNTPQLIWLYKSNYAATPPKLILPFGCLHDVFKMAGTDVVFERGFSKVRPVDFISTATLYDYQEDMVQKALKQKNGVIIMPCGSGKTQTAVELICRVSLPTLWITHTTELLNQSMTRFKENVVVNSGEVGTITGGKINIGSHITFATIQTLSKIDLEPFRDTWGMIVVDECHHAIGAPTRVMQFYSVLSILPARYKIGLTATPTRADGLEKAMFALLGDTIGIVEKKQLEDKIVPVVVMLKTTGYKPNMREITDSAGIINHVKALTVLTEDDDRNCVIAVQIKELYEDGHSVLVLSDRVKHLKILHDLSSIPESIAVSGTGSVSEKKDRSLAVQKMKDGKLKVMFATYALAKEGLDIPRLDVLVFTTPKTDMATITQACGRVARSFDGKETGFVYDYVDDHSIYTRMLGKRRTCYKKNGYQVM